MKKLFGSIVAAALAVGIVAGFAGCKTTMDPADVNELAYNIGSAAGIVVKMKGVDTNVVDKIILVADEIKLVVPDTNTSYKVAWKQAGTAIALALVAKGDIDAKAGELIAEASGTVGLAVDYLFWRHPAWKEDQQLANAAITGLVDGFKSTVKSNGLFSAGNVDQDALEFLQAFDK